MAMMMIVVIAVAVFALIAAVVGIGRKAHDEKSDL
jgi:hypothetical protein